MSTAALIRSPLYERHVALGAKPTGFGGWEMPIEYAGGGVLKEHAAVREAVGDLIAYLHGPDEVFLVPNAANTAEVARRLAAAAPAGVEVANRHREYGVLAVQGPRSADLLARLGLPADHDYMSFTESTWDGRPVVVCRTGYTGEHGYELLPGWDDAGPLWDALLAAGQDLGVRPCGLGARDTLRTEMGYPLHGQDLSLQITPVQARSGFA